MNANIVKVVKVFASPKELRDLADRMDNLWKLLGPGGSTFVDLAAVSSDGLTRVEIHLDQSFYHARAGGHKESTE